MKRRPVDLRDLCRSFVLFVMLMGFFGPAFLFYGRLSRQMRNDRAQFAAVQMASRIELLIIGRTEILGVLASVVPAAGLHTYNQFSAWTVRVERHVEAFDALTWVANDGVTTWVVPAGPHQDAVKQPWIDPREVSTYLEAARATGKPQLTHLITLNQGVKALALFYPVFNKDQQLQGWLSGAVRIDSLVGGTVASPLGDSFYMRLAFPDVPGSAFEHGQDTADAFGGDTAVKMFTVLNQRLTLSARIGETATQTHGLLVLRYLIVSGAVGASAVLSLLAYQVMASRRRLTERLEKVYFQGVLLNLLVHDIVNPLLIVRISAERAAQTASDELRDHLQKILYALGQVGDIITRVKDIRSVELGKIRLEGDAVPVNDIIEATALLFDQRCRDKGLTLDVRPCPDNPPILVDRVIFQNNVVNNLMSNAIKFTEPGGVITVQAAKRDRDVLLEVSDTGIGMSEEIRAHLFLEHVDVSKPGTMGELGTGIGMLQVRAYTRLFAGSVRVQSRPKSAGAGHGTRVSLVLPRA